MCVELGRFGACLLLKWAADYWAELGRAGLGRPAFGHFGLAVM